jgi:hypothetical protein
MAASAIRELQAAFLPAAVGTCGIVYSNVKCMLDMGKIRYADKEKQVHPYKPWNDKSDTAEPHFRAFKGCQNVTEWTVYTLPILWLFVLYSPAVPKIGAFLPWAGAGAALCACSLLNPGTLRPFPPRPH